MRCQLKSSLRLLKARFVSLTSPRKTDPMKVKPPAKLTKSKAEALKAIAEEPDSPVTKGPRKSSLKSEKKIQACTALAQTTAALKSVSENVVRINPDPSVLVYFQRLPSFHDIDNEKFVLRRKIFLVYLCVSVVLTIGAGCASPIVELMVLDYKSLLRGQIESTFVVIFAHSLLVLFLTAFGFFSYFRNGYKTIIAYTVFSLTLFILLVICIVYSLAMRHEFHEHLKPTMLRGLRNYAEVEGAESDLHWDNLQKKFQCCGLTTANDWKQNGFLHQALPDSCCKSPSEGCGKNVLVSGAESFHTQGCYQTFYAWLDVYTYCLIGFTAFMACWQALGVILAWNLSRITKLISKEQRLETRKRCCVCGTP